MIGLAVGLSVYPDRRPLLGAVVMGAVLGWVFSYFPLVALWRIRAWINGAPFHSGETVRILAGEHRDKVVSVYAVWKDRNQVRLDLGEPARTAVKDVFSYNEICREGKNEPANTPLL